MAVFQSIVNFYNYYFHELTNPMTRDWFLVSKPLQIGCILIFYFYFCTRFGPRFMKDRNPYDLTKLMLAYNVFQVLYSIYLVYTGTLILIYNDFNFKCQGLHTDEGPARELAGAVWLYFMAKVSELLDTVFFVLRKSNRQITHLHLHHHILMASASWFGTTYHPGGQAVLLGYINSMVHIFMYMYYLIAGLGGKYKKYLWWKTHMTEMQLVQFVVLLFHSVNSLFYQCDYSIVYKILSIFYCLFFIKNFGMFYYANYIKKKK